MSKTIFTFTEEFDDAGHLIKRTITTEQGETVLPVTPNTKSIDNIPIIPTPSPWNAPPDITCTPKSNLIDNMPFIPTPKPWNTPDIIYNTTGGTAHES